MARSSRANPPFRTANRDPDIFAGFAAEELHDTGQSLSLWRVDDGAVEHVDAGAVVLDLVEVGGRDPVERVAEVARDRHGLEEHLGQHHRAPDVDVDAIAEAADHARGAAEVGVRGGAEVELNNVGVAEVSRPERGDGRGRAVARLDLREVEHHCVPARCEFDADGRRSADTKVQFRHHHAR